MENKITIETIDYLSDLSKLRFTDGEKEVLVREVNGIIDLLNECDEIDVEDNDLNKTQMLTDLRLDEVSPEMDIDDVFSATKNAKNGYFVSPKVVD